MTTISAMANGAFEARIMALEAEFGAILASRIMEAEAVDFLWEARVKERYLGQHFDVCFEAEDDETELARVVILSFLGGKWLAGTCLVDGEGRPADLLWKQSFDDHAGAEFAFLKAR